MMRRKQYEALARLTMPPDDWCHVLGVIMYDPDGWRRDGKDFSEPVSLREFVTRVFSCSVGAEDGSTDLFDCECYLAEDRA